VPSGIKSFKYVADLIPETFIVFAQQKCLGTPMGFSTGSWDRPAVTPGITIQSFQITGDTKATLRLAFNQIALGFQLSRLAMSSELLKHSLADNPSNVHYPDTHIYAIAAKATDSYKAEKQKIATQLATLTSTTTTYSGSSSFGFTWKELDFYFALHLVSYTYTATKSNGKWTINMKVTCRFFFSKKNSVDEVANFGFLIFLFSFVW
jgi:hypothetical protein